MTNIDHRLLLSIIMIFHALNLARADLHFWNLIIATALMLHKHNIAFYQTIAHHILRSLSESSEHSTIKKIQELDIYNWCGMFDFTQEVFTKNAS